LNEKSSFVRRGLSVDEGCEEHKGRERLKRGHSRGICESYEGGLLKRNVSAGGAAEDGKF
jgi:hypothetical protein